MLGDQSLHNFPSDRDQGVEKPLLTLVLVISRTILTDSNSNAAIDVFVSNTGPRS